LSGERNTDPRSGTPKWFAGRSIAALAALLVLCFAVAAIGGAVTRPSIESWYAGLAKPPFNPPDRVFAPVWTLLYAMMAVAAWRIWLADPRMRSNRRALVLFALQLAFNLAWSVAFFGARSPLAGLVVILVLEGLIAATIAEFHRFDRLAAWLMVPYAAWVAFAIALNVAIYSLN
jgi:tryptophan-rich sensory protein